MAALPFAPEPFFRRRWRRRFQSYLTADLNRRDVDRQVDICAMPFESESFDFLFASHVLEHIVDDGAAISEIARVLDRADWLCWRSPSSLIEPLNILHRIPLSTDTFGRPGSITTIAIGTTSRLCWCARRLIFPAEHQLWIYEDRTGFPSLECPHRPGMEGERHVDAVPICYK